MTAYWVNDKPAPLTVDVALNGELASLEDFTTVTAELIHPAGEIFTPLTAVILEEDELVEITWPSESPLTQPGLYEIRLILEGSGIALRADSITIVVQDDTGWYDLASARTHWADAPGNDERLWQLLQTAIGDVLAYAPALGEEDPIPLNYKTAQLMQARNRWNSAITNTDGGIGGDDFIIRPFPLDWQIKQLLRPKRAIPVAT